MKSAAEIEDDLRASGSTLIAHGDQVDAGRYLRTMQRDLGIYGRCYECIRTDGARELLDPALFVRTCSKCGRGFFEATSEPLLEAVARKRCLPCR